VRHASSTWIRRTGLEAPIRLFCFPYAGGSAGAFFGLQRNLAAVEICAIQLPGRQDRLSEPPLEDLAEVVNALLPEMRALLDRPFGLFGHSSGAILAFEFAHALREFADRKLLHLFVSGASPPHLGLDHPRIGHLPAKQLLAELAAVGGLPAQILSEPGLAELLCPMLRADIRLREKYTLLPRPALLIPITAIGGRDDRFVSAARLVSWQELTTAKFEMELFPGGHLFLADQEQAVADLIERQMKRCASLPRPVSTKPPSAG
jgi:medium-chain acyl-[acyl-carrier-protein] hydrolase